MARRFLMVCIESSYGTPKATPTLGTDNFYMRLDRENAFKATAEAIQIPIAYGGGYVAEAETQYDEINVTGTYDFILYPGVWSEILLKWGIVPVNSGRTAPWTTTDSAGVMLVGDLASLSFYEANLKEDGTTFERKRYSGCKCNDWEISANETAEGRIWRMRGSWTGKTMAGNSWDSPSVSDPDATEFPAPADTSLPTGPYLFRHLATSTGTVKVGTSGSSSGTDERKATTSALTIRGRNVFGPRRYTSPYLTSNRFLGRSCSADLTTLLKMTPDDYARWRALTALDVEFKLDNGTKSVKIDFNTNNILRPVARQLPDNGEYLQVMTIANKWDSSLGTPTDITLTVA